MSEALLREAAAAKPRKLDLSEFTALYLRAHPEDRHQPDLRRRLAAAAHFLEAENKVVLPKGNAMWDRTGQVPLPMFIRLMKPKVQRPVRSSVSWVPELRWASDERDPKRLALLERLNVFLIANPGPLDPVPEKERSLEIFGDEKKISDNLKGGRFLGLIDLALMGAVRVHAPIPHETPRVPARGCPLLVVENEDSYWSLAQWNSDRGRFAAVAYGSGRAFAKSAEGLDALAAKVGAVGLRYLGDIDEQGLEIPHMVNRQRIANGLPPLEPETAFYRWLLGNGVCTVGERASTTLDKCLTWIPADLRDEVRRLLADGLRIPQESLGMRHLSRDFN